MSASSNFAIADSTTNITETSSSSSNHHNSKVGEDLDIMNHSWTEADMDSNSRCSSGARSPDSDGEKRRGRPRSDIVMSLILQGSSSPSNIKCQYCTRVFPREKSLQAHLRTHTGEKPYVCDFPDCSRAFTQSGQLKTHQRLHAGEKPFVCSHPGCTVRFTHANRHCPSHPNAVLKRSNDFVVRSVGVGDVKEGSRIQEWLEKYKRDREEACRTGKPRPKKRKISMALSEQENMSTVSSLVNSEVSGPQANSFRSAKHSMERSPVKKLKTQVSTAVQSNAETVSTVDNNFIENEAPKNSPIKSRPAHSNLSTPVYPMGQRLNNDITNTIESGHYYPGREARGRPEKLKRRWLEAALEQSWSSNENPLTKDGTEPSFNERFENEMNYANTRVVNKSLNDVEVTHANKGNLSRPSVLVYAPNTWPDRSNVIHNVAEGEEFNSFQRSSSSSDSFNHHSDFFHCQESSSYVQIRQVSNISSLESDEASVHGSATHPDPLNLSPRPFYQY